MVGRRRAVRCRRQRARPRRTAWNTFLAGQDARAAVHRRARRVGGVAQAARARPQRDRDRGLAPGRDRAAHGPDPRAVQRQPAPPQPRHDPRELPPGGWHTGWVRDATYAIVALARSGHGDRGEGRARLLPRTPTPAAIRASSTNQPYRISTVRYFGDGQEEADYSGQPTPQHRDRRLGPVAVGRAHVRRLPAPTPRGSTRRRRRATPSTTRSRAASPSRSIANLETSGIAIADASIWEVHWGNRQHFLYTTRDGRARPVRHGDARAARRQDGRRRALPHARREGRRPR